MRVRFLSVFFGFVAIFSLFISILRGEFAYAEEFLFVAEIPTYAPFKGPIQNDQQLEALLNQEIRYFCEKEKSDCQTLAKKDPDPHQYEIAPPESGKQERPWRGKLTLYEGNKEKPIPANTRSILNLDTDTETLKSVIQLFENEAFGASNEESLEQTDKKLRLVLLANRMKSIFAVKNQSLKIPQNFRNAFVLRGAWEPRWKDIKTGNHASIREVRQYSRHCWLRATRSRLGLKRKNAFKKQVKELFRLETSLQWNHVPYHELREHLRAHPGRDRFVKGFVDTVPNARLYEATHDSDLVHLRVPTDGKPADETLGLYSHYEALLNSEVEKGNSLPSVLTTGYRIAYEAIQFKSPSYFAWIYQAIEEDRYARAAISRADFRAAYISEPNVLYLVPEGEVHIGPSFLKLSKKVSLVLDRMNSYDPCESIAIMNQLYESDKDSRVLFDPGHPVLMKIPPRMLLSKTKKNEFNLEGLGKYDDQNDQFEVENLESVLQLSTEISQSPFSYRNYTSNLYRQMGLVRQEYSYNGTKITGANNLFRSLGTSLLNLYDIKNGDFSDGQIKAPTELKLNLNLSNTPEGSGVKNELDAINKLPTITEKIEALQILLNNVFRNNTGDKLVAISQEMGKAREDHYRNMLSPHAKQQGKRTFPAAIINLGN